MTKQQKSRQRPSAPVTPMGAISTASFWLILALVALAPIPFASVEPFWRSVIVLVAGAALLLAAPAAFRSGARAGTGEIAMGALLAAVVVWACVQALLPVGPGLAHFAWGLLPAPEAAAPRLSAAPDATLRAAAGLLALGAVGFLGWLHGAEPARARLALQVLAAMGTLIAAYGLYAYFSDRNQVLWIEKRAYLESLTATFINRNSVAPFFGVTLILLAAITRDALPRRQPDEPWRIYAADTIKVLLGRRWPLLLAFAVVGIALVLTASRGGVTSSLLGIAAFAACLMIAGRSSRRVISLAALGAVLVTFLLLVAAGDTLLGRALADSGGDARGDLYAAALAAIRDAPLAGHGYGSFPHVFTFYADTPRLAFSHWLYAHNTYLHLALELGVPAALTLIAVPAIALFMCLRAIAVRRRHRTFAAVAVGAATIFGIHATVDFSVQIPANALLFAFLLGIGVAQSRPSLERRASRR